MKNKISLFLLLYGFTFLSSCNDLNLNPLSEGSSENWYTNESEINMSLSDLYRMDFWRNDRIAGNDLDVMTDDEMYRAVLYPFTSGTLNGTYATINSWWSNAYACIARANTVLANLDRAKGIISQTLLDQYAGEAKFIRAAQYSMLISYWGDVVYSTAILSLEEAYSLSKTDKRTILKNIYDDFDFATSKLPTSYSSTANMRATKGAAMAMKARVALFFGDWAIARDAAKACIDLNVYQLYPDYSTLFLSKTKNPAELIFGIPRSTVLNEVIVDCKQYVPRNAGGFGANFAPSWELFCSYLCTDGLPIDESPLFNPRLPFKNRDPRCTATIVEFGIPWLGFLYQPHPDSLKTLNLSTGLMVTNNDTRSNAQFASYNALMWKKGIDDDYLGDYKAENEMFIMRYADVLLMYAEAKTELGEIDQAMLDASINKVRARAYKVNVTDKTSYPAITSTDKIVVRKAVRIERRMEFAWESRRYEDLIRWKMAEKVLNRKVYGMLDPAELRIKVVKPGLWFFPRTPEIDDDGSVNLEPLYNDGLIKLIAVRNFPLHQYLFPIPTKEIQINKNLAQNPGY